MEAQDPSQIVDTIDKLPSSAAEIAKHLPAANTDARNDTEALALWLNARAQGSPSTLDRYLREGRRFLAFLDQHNRELRTATLEDVLAYQEALQRPQPNGHRRSPAAVDGVFSVLGSMTGLLYDLGYLKRNILIRRNALATNNQRRNDRFLSNAEIEALSAEAEAGVNQARAARVRFLLAWFLATGARITETLNSPMSNVYMAPERGQNQWLWRVSRKGGQTADLPLRNDAMDALVGYRRHLGMELYPLQDRDEGYLVQPLRGPSRQPLWRGTISNELKRFFQAAVMRLDDPGLQAHMAQATTHWLRHTGATRLLDAGASMRFVSKLLGHASIKVTSQIYDHAERATWRQEIEKGPAYRY